MLFAFAMIVTIFEPGWSFELWKERGLFSWNNLETQYLRYFTGYNSQNIHNLFGKNHRALNRNSRDVITVIVPVITCIHKLVNTGIFQKVLEGALNGKKESI